MSVTFLNPEPAAPEAVDAVESRLRSRLPGEFRELLVRSSNGGEIKPAVAASASEVGVVAILGAGRGDLLDLERRAAQYRDGRLPEGLIPVADAEGGNLVCLSVRSEDFGTVWFWDHEKEIAGDPARPIAANFSSFLADLEPISSPEPTGLTEAWIDPSLLDKLEDNGN